MRLVPESALHPKLKEVARIRKTFRSGSNVEEGNISNEKSN
jgi:hypothetical protein